MTMLEQGPTVDAAIGDEAAACTEDLDALPTAFELPKKRVKL